MNLPSLSKILKQASEQELLAPANTERLAILVGPLSSRESVKDEILSLRRLAGRGALLGDVVPTLDEIAKQVLFLALAEDESASALVLPAEVLPTYDQWDLLDRLTTHFPFLKERAVQKQVARFLQNLDEFSPTPQDRDAILDVLTEREPQLAQVGQMVFRITGQSVGEFSRAALLRKIIEILNDEDLRQRIQPQLSFDTLVIWAWPRRTPLEEALLEALKKIVSIIDFSFSEESLNNGQDLSMALYHTPWDGFANLKQQLQQLHAEGAPWKRIALRVSSADAVTKRILRDLLLQWNVPIHDPTLAKAWVEVPAILWWKSLMEVWTSRFDAAQVTAFVGALGDGAILNDLRLKLGTNEGASSWGRIILEARALGTEPSWLPLLQWSLDLFAAFAARKNTPMDLHEKWHKELRRRLIAILDQQAKANIATSENSSSGDPAQISLFDDFLEHLTEQRPFLESRKLSFMKVMTFFDEFLERSAKTFSLRNAHGLWLVDQEFLLPFDASHEFALGLNCWELEVRRSPGAAEFEGDWLENNEKIKNIWSRLHFDDSLDLRVVEHHRKLKRVLFGSVELPENAVKRKMHIQNWAHDISGQPVALLSTQADFLKDHLSALSEEVLLVAQTEVIARPEVGWTVHPNRVVVSSSDSANVAQISEVPEAPQVLGSLRISAFEDYLKCPFIYYVRHVERAESPEDLEIQAKPQDKGRILHLIFETVLKRGCQQWDQVNTIFDEIMDQQTQRSDAKKPFAGIYRDPAVYARIVTDLRDTVRRWWDFEMELRANFPDLKPRSFEKSVSLKLENGFELKGRIDRVDEVLLDGGRIGFFIWDYKTGSTSLFNGKELLSGLGVQLLGYAFGLFQNDEEFKGKTFVGASYLELGKKIQAKKGIYLKEFQGKAFKIHSRNSGLQSEEAFSDQKQSLLSLWTAASERLKARDFAPKPYHEKLCTFCKFSSFCGYAGTSS